MTALWMLVALCGIFILYAGLERVSGEIRQLRAELSGFHGAVDDISLRRAK
jgi:hypothetical protein